MNPTERLVYLILDCVLIVLVSMFLASVVTLASMCICWYMGWRCLEWVVWELCAVGCASVMVLRRIWS